MKYLKAILKLSKGILASLQDAKLKSSIETGCLSIVRKKKTYISTVVTVAVSSNKAAGKIICLCIFNGM